MKGVLSFVLVFVAFVQMTGAAPVVAARSEDVEHQNSSTYVVINRLKDGVIARRPPTGDLVVKKRSDTDATDYGDDDGDDSVVKKRADAEGVGYIADDGDDDSDA